MPKRKKPVCRAWRAGSFTVLQVGRKAWQLADIGSWSADMYGCDWQDTEFDTITGPTFAKRRDRWIMRSEASELSPTEARRLNAARLRAMKGK